MRLGFAGTPVTAADSLRALLATHHTVEFVVTRPDAPVGRGRVMTPSPVAHLAEQAQVRCVKADGLAGLEDMCAAVDCVVVVAYGALVHADALLLPAHGMLNVHYSLLPRWRGAAPVQRAIAAGDTQSGVSVFRLDTGMDTGPVLAQRAVDIRTYDTAGDLLERLTPIGAELLVDTLDRLERGPVRAEAQLTDGITLAPKVTTAQARIDWRADADTVDRLVRAMTPTPGAWCDCGGERVKIAPVVPRPQAEALAPGQVQIVHGTVLAGTGTHPVELTHVQRAGRTAVPALVWAPSRAADLS